MFLQQYKCLRYALFCWSKKLHANTACHFDPLPNLDIGLFGQAGNAQRELDNLGLVKVIYFCSLVGSEIFAIQKN